MEKRKIILCDTGVFIEYFRGNTQVIAELDAIGMPNLYISSVSVGEIYFGMRKGEKRKTTELVNAFNVIHVNTEISRLFLQLMLGHLDLRISIPDAFIAATALVSNAQLFTFNRQDFDYIGGIKLYSPVTWLK